MEQVAELTCHLDDRRGGNRKSSRRYRSWAWYIYATGKRDMVARMVYFYEIRPAGRVSDAGWKLDMDGLVAHLGALGDEARISEFHGNPDGYYEFVDAHPYRPFPLIVYARCRSEGLPVLAHRATLEALEIAAGHSLAELTTRRALAQQRRRCGV